MPPPPGQRSKSSKKKKKSFWDRIPGSKIASQTVKDVGEIASDVPGAVLQTGRAVKKDFLAGPKFVSPRNPLDLARNEDKDLLGELFNESIRANQATLRHPLRNPGYTAAALLGLAPAGTSLAGTTLRGVTRKPKKAPAKTRKISHKVRTEKEAERFSRALGTKVKVGSLVHAELPASRVSSTRAAQKGADYLRSKSPKRQRRKVEKAIARRQDLESRPFQGNPKGIIGALKELNTAEPWQAANPFAGEGAKAKGKALNELLLREPNAAIRAARLYRLAYVLPNRLGAETTALVHAGPRRYAKGIVEQRRERKRNPETAQVLDRMGGETLSEAAFGGGSGPMGTLARGIGTDLSKLTDRGPRARIMREELRREGVAAKDVDALVYSAMNGNKASMAKLVRAADRAEHAAIRFTRSGRMKDAETGDSIGPLGVTEAIDKTLADNVFLYKWLTGSGRYAGHTVAEHPVLTAALASAGQQAPEITDVFPEVPEFMDARLPFGESERIGGGGMLPTTVGAQAASLYDYPFEILRTLQNSVRDPREISDIFNPVQASGFNAITGFDPFRDQELMSRRNPEADLMERLRFGAATQLRSIPWLEWGEINDSAEEQEGRLYQTDPRDILLRQLLLGGLWPVRTDPKVVKRMAKSQKKRKNR